MRKKNYVVTVKDSATYIIKAETEEDAIELALDYFAERKPYLSITETDEEAEVEI